MSRKKHFVDLKGYGDPIFTKNVVLLNTVFNRLDMNSKTPNVRVLKEIGKVIEGYKGSRRVITSDGYCWALGLRFLRAGIELLVAFPFISDKNCGGNVWLDRSIAIYTKGFGPYIITGIKEIVSELTHEIKRIVIICNARSGSGD